MSNELEEDPPNVGPRDGLANKIRNVLDIYPGISPSMLSAGLGNQHRAEEWRTVLQDLIDNGEVIEEIVTRRNAYRRPHSYTKLSLKPAVEEQNHDRTGTAH